jgi:hypothetical protein
MANKKKEQVMKLSYESDGKMGHSISENQKSRPKKVEFFNTTPESE